MVLTRAEQQSALKHILETVFNLPTNSPIHKSFAYNFIESPYDIIFMEERDFEKLDYYNDDNKVLLLKKGHIGLLRAFQYFILYQHQNSFVHDDFCMSITREEFNIFRISPNYLVTLSEPPVATDTTIKCYSSLMGEFRHQ